MRKDKYERGVDYEKWCAKVLKVCQTLNDIEQYRDVQGDKWTNKQLASHGGRLDKILANPPKKP